MDWLFDEDDERKAQETSVKDKEKLDEIWNDLHKAYEYQPDTEKKKEGMCSL